MPCMCSCPDTPKTYPQVEGGSVSQAHALHPAIAALDLSIPAVFCIVRHLMLQVLPESQPLGADADGFEEQEGAADEVGQRLVGDGACAARWL